MPVTEPSTGTPWLLLVFSLPAQRASQRVEVWRKLQRYGAVALRSSGYVLPNSAANQERLEWLAAAIRNYRGQASVVQVHSFDDLPPEKLQQIFLEARSRDYELLHRELKKVLAVSSNRRSSAALSRVRRRFQEITAIDFFQSPLRSRVETLLARADEPSTNAARNGKGKLSEYRNRAWITRPRPGIDRVSSAWLIRRFIDPKARFLFANDPSAHPDAIPFDMFVPQGFGHRGEDCTFETLRKEFAIRDPKVKRIAQSIHDADLSDEKFGRAEGQGLDQVLNGWARQGIADDELLQRGMDLIEGLYHALQ
ncbi:MAG TPA: chromate resistance protein ChrB domain-containing protein [Terriglobales bacterium]|nr:chromate resistance protein ChrB domain-containing protein [Terriglobales bacterium]